MANIYNNSTKKWEDVPDSDVPSGVAAGKYSFEKDLEIPVIDKDGRMGTVSASDAHIAFKQGARLPTAEDQAADFEKKNKEILRRQYGEDNLINAGTAGVIRGVVPFADAAMIGMGALAGKGEAVKEGLSQLKEQNPTTSILGEVAGTLSPYSVVGKAAGAAGKVIPEAVATANAVKVGLKGGTAATKASQVLENVATAGLGSAVEGMVYGANTGISEAILGDPDEVAENLLYNTAFGGLFGGLGGAAIGGAKEAAPLLKAINKKVAEFGDSAVQATARGAVRTAALPAVAMSQGTKAAKIASEIIGDAEGRAGEKFARETLMGADEAGKAAEKVVSRQIKEAEAGLIKAAKDWPADVKQVIKDTVDTAAGDLSEAQTISYRTFQKIDEPFKAQLAADTRPGMIIGDVFDATEQTIKNLEKQGTAAAKAKAQELTDILYAGDRRTAAALTGSERAATLSQKMTVGDEILLARELRNMVQPYQKSISSIGEKGRKEAIDLWNQLDGQLKNYPVEEYAKQISDGDRWYRASSEIGRLTGKGSLAKYTPVSSKIRSTFSDPVKSDYIDEMLNNVTEFIPYFEKLKGVGSNLQAQKNIALEMSNKIKELSGKNLNGRLSADDALEMMNQFGGTKAMIQRSDKLKELQSTFSTSTTLKPIEKLIKINKALGRPVDDALEAARPFQEIHQKMRELTKTDKETASLLNRLLTKGAKIAVGTTVGGPIGAVAGALDNGTGFKGADALRMFDGLTAIERFSNKAFNRMEQSIEKAGRALVSDKGRQAVVATSVYKPLSDRRKEFKDKAAYLANFAVPDQAAQYIEKTVGQLPGAPNIQAAVGARLINTATFLNSKLPTDPLAGQSIFVDKSGWTPSDFELARFERYVDAAENPQQVLENITKGDVSPEEIETLKTLYPGVFNKLQNRVINDIIDNGANMSYQQRITIGTLFNVPSDPTLTPQFIQAMQATYAVPPQGRPNEGTTRGPKSKLDLNIEQSAMTDTQRITQK